MAAGLILHGAKKLAKKIGAKKAAPKTAKEAARASAKSRGLAKMDGDNRSATSIAQDIRSGADKMQRKANRITAQSDRRLVGAGVGGTAAAGAAMAYDERRKKKKVGQSGGARENVRKARDRTAEELRKMGQ